MTQNREQKQRFTDLLVSGGDSGAHSHAYIIEGGRGVGKTDFALFCAAAILCVAPSGKARPCTQCGPCRKVFGVTHPDLHIYGGEDGKPITMKEVRELINSTYLLPNDGDKKVYIIKNAHRMRPDTQNAMLKVFEEPPPSAVLFLLTEKKEALLPTVLSRGRLIMLSGESEEFIAAYLAEKHKKLSQGEIEAAVRASEGSVGLAEKFLSRESRDARGRAAGLLELLFEGGKLDFYRQIVSARITREKLLDLLELLQEYITDVIKAKCGAGAPVLLKTEEAAAYGGRVTKKTLSLMSEAITDCRKTLEQSGNINAAVSNLGAKLWSLRN